MERGETFIARPTGCRFKNNCNYSYLFFLSESLQFGLHPSLIRNKVLFLSKPNDFIENMEYLWIGISLEYGLFNDDYASDIKGVPNGTER
jgi:hypothetical protein